MNSSGIQVLIVGAGPTGLTAGLELVRQGVRAKIIERRDGGSTLSRAVGILPRSLELLKPSGVTEELVARGIKYRCAQFYQGSKPVARIQFSSAPMQYGFDYVLGLPQDVTEGLLRERFLSLGGEIHYDQQLAGLQQTGDQVVARTKDGGEHTCDYLIGADGTRSATRESLNIEYVGFDFPEVWSVADIDVESWIHPDAVTVSQLPDGELIIIAQLEDNRIRMVSTTRNSLETAPFDIRPTNVRRQGEFKVSVRQARQYSQGRVYLTGDAAHCHSPVGGRGMNLGIADSVELAARIAHDRLGGYGNARHLDGERVIADSERLRKVLRSRGKIGRTLTVAGLKAAQQLPALERWMASRFLYGETSH